MPFITALSRGADHRNRPLLRLADLLAFYFAGPAAAGAAGRVNVADEALQYQLVRCLPCPVSWMLVVERTSTGGAVCCKQCAVSNVL